MDSSLIYNNNYDDCKKSVSKTICNDTCIQIIFKDYNSFEYTTEYLNTVINYYENHNYLVGNYCTSGFHHQGFEHGAKIYSTHDRIEAKIDICISSNYNKYLCIELEKEYINNNAITEIKYNYYLLS